MKVLVATEKPFAAAAVNGIKAEIEAAGNELVLLEKYTEKAQLLDAVKDADAMIIRLHKWSMFNGQWSMITLKFLHAGDEGFAAFDGLGVVARSAEAADTAVTLHTDHTLRYGKVEEVLLQFLIFRSHHEAEVHQRTVLFLSCANEHLVAVDLAIDDFCTLLCQLVHSFNTTVLLDPT